MARHGGARQRARFVVGLFAVVASLAAAGAPAQASDVVVWDEYGGAYGYPEIWKADPSGGGAQEVGLPYLDANKFAACAIDDQADQVKAPCATYTPRLGPGSTYMVFTTQPGDLYRSDLDGGHLEPLIMAKRTMQWASCYSEFFTCGAEAWNSPDVSPDGRWIVLLRHDNYDTRTAPLTGPDELWLVHPDGSGLHQIATWAGSPTTPRFSSDGSRIYFQSGMGPDGSTYDGVALWSVDLTGGDPRVVASHSSGEPFWYSLAPSPNGRDILASEDREPFGLFQLHTDGTAASFINPAFGEWWMRPDFSPDGSQIVYVSFNNGGGAQWLAVANADGTGAHRIRALPEAGLEASPDWGSAPGRPPLDPDALNGGPDPDAPNVVKTCAADPVDCATGNFYTSYTDLKSGGRGTVPFQLTRTYNAQPAAKSTSLGPFGHGWSWNYGDSLTFDSATGTALVSRSQGQVSAFVRNSSGVFVGPAWSQASLVRNADSTWTYTTAHQEKLAFDTTGRLTSITDRNGNATKLTYSTKGTATISIADPAARVIKLTLNANGTVASATDPANRTVAYTYDASGNLTAVKDVGLKTTSFAYDSKHRMTQITDVRGATLTNTYDSSGRTTSQTDALGHKTTWDYDYQHTTITDPDGDVTDETFDNYQPIRIVYAKGTADESTWRYAYDESGRLKTLTDPAGGVTTYGYDADGNRTSERQPEGQTTTWTYDSTRNVKSITTPMGRRVQYDHDAKGNPITITRSMAGSTVTQVTRYTYDAYGQVTKVTDPIGRAWTYAYDAYGDRTTATSPSGAKDTATFTVNALQATSVSPRGNVTGAKASQYTTTFTRDAYGRVTDVADPLAKHKTMTYDALGNITAVTDADGRVTSTTYDLLNRPVEVTKPSGAKVKLAYGPGGELQSRTDGLGRITRYAYDHQGRPTAVTDPLARTTAFAYDASGNLVTTTDADGRTISYAYDAMKRLLSTTSSSGSPAPVTYTYDADGNRVSMADATGTTRYSYDTLGRLADQTAGSGQKTTYTYDLAGQLTSIGYPVALAPAPAGQSPAQVPTGTVTHTYDADGHLASVKDWLNHTTTFTYGSDGELKSEVLPNGKSVTFTYDVRDIVTGVSGPAGALTYGRSSAGKITSRTLGTATTAYTYDTGGRLATAGSAAYAHDLADQVTKLTSTGGPLTQAFDAGGQIQSATAGTTAVATFSFDRNGNRIGVQDAAGSATLTYDQANRLTSYAGPDRSQAQGTVTQTYAYDGDGLRQSKTTAGTVTYQAYDMTGNLPLLITDGSTAYVNGAAGLPIEQILADGTVRYLSGDATGNVTAVTNQAGTVLTTYSYDAYGNRTASGQALSLPFGFGGQYTDAETGYQYLRARYYDPRTAQFLTVDPLAERTWSRYGFANGDPINGADPSGLCNVNPLSDQNCAYQLADKIGIADDVGNAAVWLYDRRGPVASFAAGLGCLVPGVDVAACAYLTFGALGVTAQQDIAAWDPCQGVMALFAKLTADAVVSLGPLGVAAGVEQGVAEMARIGMTVPGWANNFVKVALSSPNLIMDSLMMMQKPKH